MVTFSLTASILSRSYTHATRAGAAGARTPAATCSPQPCTDAEGFTLYVVGVEWNFVPGAIFKPEPGDQFARVSVRLVNRAAGERHVDPFHSLLQDQQGVKHSVSLVEAGWLGVNVIPGGRFGPRWVDFEVTSGTASGMLVWTPDFRDHDIPLG